MRHAPNSGMRPADPGAEPTALDADPNTEGVADQSRSVLRLLIQLFSMRAATWLTASATVLIVPRFLGARAFGELTIALAFNDYAASLTLFGARRLIVREVARAPGSTWTIVLHAIGTRFATWMVIAAVVAPGILLLPHLLGQPAVLLLFVASLGVQAVQAIVVEALQGRHHLGGAAVFTTIVETGAQIGVVVVVVRGAGILAIAAVMVAGWVVAGAGVLWILWRFSHRRARWDGALARRLMRGGVPFLLSDLAQLVYGRVDILMLAFMATAADVGNYALAWRVTAIPVFIGVALRGALLPTLSVAALSNQAYFRRLLATSLRMLLAMMVPLSFGIAALAPEAVTLVAGPTGYGAAVPSMVVLSLAMPLVAVDTLLSGALIAVDVERPWALVGWGSALLNPAMNLVAIPLAARAWGDAAIGAAATTLLTEVFMTFWAWRLLHGAADLRAAFFDAGRAVAAGIPMVIVVLALKGQLGTFAVIPVGAAVYLAGAVVTRLLTLSDLRAARALIRGGSLELQNEVPAEGEEADRDRTHDESRGDADERPLPVGQDIRATVEPPQS